jgi:RNA polymerase sigma-70 factor (ECF subfamily)
MWLQTSTTLEPTLEAAPAGAHGAGESFGQILAREQPKIQGMLRKHLGARQDIDDLVQTVFLELMRSLPRFRGESSMSTFVGGITMMVIRRARRGTTWDHRKQPIEDAVEETAPSPEDRAIAREQVRRLEDALDEIGETKRNAFLLWSLGGQTPQEIADLTKTSLPATRSRIFYARKELAAAAKKDAYLAELV